MYKHALARAIRTALFGSLVLLPALAHADDHDDVDEYIVVTATKTPRTASSVAATVDVITSDDLERQQAADLKDAVRYMPGVSVRNNAERFGLSDINIRGLDGNRVLMEVDGVRVADTFSIGSYSNASRNAIDIDTVKAIEVVRGAASSLYGSNAIGGVVTFVTKDPADYLKDQSLFLGSKTGYASASDEWTQSLTTAFGNDTLSALVHVTGRNGHETENQGDNTSQDSSRTATNPQDAKSGNVLAKVVYAPTDQQRFKFTFDRHQDTTDTEVYSSRTSSTSTQVTDLDGEDRLVRTRYQLDWTFSHLLPGVDSGLVQIYRQDTETRQDTDEARTTSSVDYTRHRRFSFDSDATGAEVTFNTHLDLGETQHTLTWGGEWVDTDIAEMRNGSQTNLATGTTSNVVSPDTFPVRDIPLSTTTETGIYLQDEIDLFAGQWQLIPGLRYDRFELDATSDTIFSEDNPGVEMVDSDDHHWSPKLATLIHLTPQLAVTAQYSTGFRAPPYSDVNFGFTNLTYGYTAIANPNLKPETSRNLEVGLRGQHVWGSWQVTAYRNRYQDFIESLSSLGYDADTGLLTFQSINIDNATIEGFEAGANLDLQSLLGWNGVVVRAAYGYAHGEDEASGDGLNAVDPGKLVVGVGWEDPSATWGGEFVTTAVQAKHGVDDDSLFRAPGYAVFDLTAYAMLNDHVTVRGGVFNIADRKYWEWADVRGVAASSSVLDRYTQSGRNFAISLYLTY